MSAWARSSPALIWHIFRKDLKLLWPLAAGVLAGQLALAILLARAEPFAPSQEMLGAVIVLSGLLVIGIAALILLAVQQDPVPGAGQDWLVRPIRRRDLAAAKLLFVLLAIHGPASLVDLLHGLWGGLPLADCLQAALSRNLFLLLVLSLPLVTIGALTRTVTEAILGTVLASFALNVVLLVLLLLTHMDLSLRGDTLGTPLGWVWRSAALGVFLLALGTVLSLQYARRLTWTGRAVLSAALLVSGQVTLLPFRPAFAIQAWLSPDRAAGRALAVAFDPAARPVPGPARADTAQLLPDHGIQAGVNLQQVQVGVPEQLVTLLLPLRFTGVPAGTLLHIDRTQLAVLDASGKTLYEDSTAGGGLSPAPGPGEPLRLSAGVRIPAAIDRQLRDLPVRLQIEVAVTLLGARPLAPLPALGGAQRVAGVGRCATRVDDTGMAIELGCIAAGEWPACLSMQLALPAGARNPAAFLCSLDYSPWREHFALDAISQSGASLPFRDPSGRARYPVGAAQLHDAQVLLTQYEPIDHLVRRLEVAQLHLRDLPSAPAVPAGPVAPPPAGPGSRGP